MSNAYYSSYVYFWCMFIFTIDIFCKHFYLQEYNYIEKSQKTLKYHHINTYLYAPMGARSRDTLRDMQIGRYCESVSLTLLLSLNLLLGIPNVWQTTFSGIMDDSSGIWLICGLIIKKIINYCPQYIICVEVHFVKHRPFKGEFIIKLYATHLYLINHATVT